MDNNNDYNALMTDARQFKAAFRKLDMQQQQQLEEEEEAEQQLERQQQQQQLNILHFDLANLRRLPLNYKKRQSSKNRDHRQQQWQQITGNNNNERDRYWYVHDDDDDVSNLSDEKNNKWGRIDYDNDNDNNDKDADNDDDGKGGDDDDDNLYPFYEYDRNNRNVNKNKYKTNSNGNPSKNADVNDNNYGNNYDQQQLWQQHKQQQHIQDVRDSIRLLLFTSKEPFSNINRNNNNKNGNNNNNRNNNNNNNVDNKYKDNSNSYKNTNSNDIINTKTHNHNKSKHNAEGNNNNNCGNSFGDCRNDNHATATKANNQKTLLQKIPFLNELTFDRIPSYDENYGMQGSRNTKRSYNANSILHARQRTTYQSLCPTKRLTILLETADYEYRPNNYVEVTCAHRNYPFTPIDEEQDEEGSKNGICSEVGFNCIQHNRTIHLIRHKKTTPRDCWEAEVRIIPSGCECMWPKHLHGDILTYHQHQKRRQQHDAWLKAHIWGSDREEEE